MSASEREHDSARRPRSSHHTWRGSFSLVVAMILAGCSTSTPPAAPPPPTANPSTSAPPATAVTEVSEASIHQLCERCHAWPPPDSFPRELWRQEVRQAFRFIREARTPPGYPDEESVVRYFESRAPAAFPPWEPSPLANAQPAPWQPTPVTCSLHPTDRLPAVASVQAVQLRDATRHELLVCDADSGLVLLYRPDEPADPWQLLARLPSPATGCVVDLDQDGIRDLVIADLGRLVPGDEKLGKVVWLRGHADGSFTEHILARGLGRVADVRAADLRGTGRLDLIVAVYGWRKVGEILLLENQVEDWSAPRFAPRVIDPRHGAIHVPITDLNGDQRLDFVALLAQEHEQVVAYLKQADGSFQPQIIYRAPHPAFGCCGLELVDMNGDGALDVLLTNGDTLDGPAPVRPYNGIRWLENGGTFPFTEHFLAALPGAMRALAVDIDRDGDQDVVATSYLPAEYVAPAERAQMDSLILLEQTAQGEFVRHVLERGLPDHVCLVAGDWRGDGRVGLVTGQFSLPRTTPVTAAERPLLTFWDASAPADAAPATKVSPNDSARSGPPEAPGGR
ncbi:MAG: VCBS repeat-containing protein [Pirellulales bacterium]